MRIVSHLGLAIAAALFALCTLEITGQLPIPGADRLVSTAHAVVGRPLTPSASPARPGAPPAGAPPASITADNKA